MKVSKSFNYCLVTMMAFISIIPLTNQLECYVCQNQPDNKNKCAETVKICDLSQDQCLTEVRWGSTPHWAQTDQKQHFISKRCASKMECEEAKADKIHKCDRIWYNDWNCTTCCSGDKCNFYVTLAGRSNRPSNILLILASLIATLFATFRHEMSTRRAEVVQFC